MRYAVFIIFITVLLACNSNQEKITTPPVIHYKPDTAIQKVVINISDTFILRKTILYIIDSAASNALLNQKLNTAFSKTLPDFAHRHGLELVGPPMAWFLNNQPPFYFEAGIPVNQHAAKAEKYFFYKTIGGDSALLAQFYGPYSGTGVAYQALQEYMKDHHRKLRAKPYEIYVDKPFDALGKPKNPYKVETDIVFPIQRK